MIRHVGPPIRFGYHPWWGTYGGLIMALLFLALIVVVAWGIWRLTRMPVPAAAPVSSGGAPAWAARPDAALDQLRMRYARGEVGRDEFLQASSDLGDPGAAAASPWAEPPAASAPVASPPTAEAPAPSAETASVAPAEPEAQPEDEPPAPPATTPEA
jgi:putative membrane protein